MKLVLPSFLLVSIFSSCSFYTEISYRSDRKSEYTEEDGFMLNCRKDHFSYGDVLILGTYTPETWGDGFYYDYLDGLPSDKTIRILDTQLRATSTTDTLTVTEIRDKRIYIYQSSDLKTVIRKNKQLELTICYQENEDTTILQKTFLLTRHRHTYPTGTFPHTFKDYRTENRRSKTQYILPLRDFYSSSLVFHLPASTTFLRNRIITLSTPGITA